MGLISSLTVVWLWTVGCDSGIWVPSGRRMISGVFCSVGCVVEGDSFKNYKLITVWGVLKFAGFTCLIKTSSELITGLVSTLHDLLSSLGWRNRLL